MKQQYIFRLIPVLFAILLYRKVGRFVLPVRGSPLHLRIILSHVLPFHRQVLDA